MLLCVNIEAEPCGMLNKVIGEKYPNPDITKGETRTFIMSATWNTRPMVIRQLFH